MFVMSFIIVVVFIVNFSFKIIIIKCFGIYVGIVIFCKFSMMVMWFFVVCVINESVQILWLCVEKFLIYKLEFLYQNYVVKFVCFVFSDFFLRVVIKFCIFWILLFLVFILGGLEVFFFKFGFYLFILFDFQMFELLYFFEVYEFYFKDRFCFEISFL